MLNSWQAGHSGMFSIRGRARISKLGQHSSAVAEDPHRLSPCWSCQKLEPPASRGPCLHLQVAHRVLKDNQQAQPRMFMNRQGLSERLSLHSSSCHIT